MNAASVETGGPPAATACPVCGSSAFGQSFDLSRGPVDQCRECGVFISRDRSISEAQDAQFHESLDSSQYVDYFEPFRKRQYREVLAKLGAAPGKSLLDVGASFGWMVEVGMELGFDACGIEPSPVDYSPNLGPRITPATLGEYVRTAERVYDVVTIWHVMEHVRDPFVSAKELSRLLSDDGQLVIAVPSATGTMYRAGLFAARRLGRRRLMEELWYTHNQNMHRYYFTPRAITLVLAQAGLRVTDTYTLDAFDWKRIWRRSTNSVARTALRISGPLLDRVGVTRNENLIVVAMRTAHLR